MMGIHFRGVLVAIVLLGTWILPSDAESQCEPGADVIPPVITCPADVTLECGSSTDPSNTGMPVVTDNCPMPSTVFSDVEEPGSCPGSRTITRTWRAIDAAGNTASCAQNVVVQCCLELFCSLTQGAYGKAGGRFNGQE